MSYQVATGGRTPDGPGALYMVDCPESSSVSVVWRADGDDDAVVAIYPEVLARQALDSMTLRPPDIASTSFLINTATGAGVGYLGGTTTAGQAVARQMSFARLERSLKRTAESVKGMRDSR
ncbi:hypothetical protein AB0L20_22655 [Streptomyces albidoflavus]|uniref:hypothetical protein n=1 Tax=Streptomyces albidoflavus TaxID=1886 RepID=UPI0034270BB1